MSVEHFLWSALCLYGTSPGVHYVCRTLPLECTMFVWHSPGVHYICRTLLLEYTMSVWHFPWSTLCLYDTSPGVVPAGSPPRGGDVAVYVFDINSPSLPTPFYSVLVSVFVFMALSIVFQSINSPDNARFSHSVLPVLFLLYWSFQLYISS